MKMYTVPTMHAIFVVHCCGISMKPLNRTQATNVLLWYNYAPMNQPTTFFDWDEGAPKNTFALAPHICRSVPLGTPIFPLCNTLLLLEVYFPVTHKGLFL